MRLNQVVKQKNMKIAKKKNCETTRIRVMRNVLSHHDFAGTAAEPELDFRRFSKSSAASASRGFSELQHPPLLPQPQLIRSAPLSTPRCANRDCRDRDRE